MGKAAPFMSDSLAKILGNRLTEGIVVCGPGQRISSNKIICLPAAHPLPDKKSIRAARRIVSLADKTGPNDLVFVLISGGASAQICLPRRPVTLAAKKWVTDSLLRAGADIVELNTVRKHLSSIKGGRLAEAAYPAAVVNLVLSDVVGNDLENVASGPTYWDSTTYADARRILKKYRLWTKAPASVRAVIQAGLSGRIPETLKKGDRVFQNVSTFLIGDNGTALRAAARPGQGAGFSPGYPLRRRFRGSPGRGPEIYLGCGRDGSVGKIQESAGLPLGGRRVDGDGQGEGEGRTEYGICS